ncbi:MAG: hypothetical protein AB7J13_09920, partial [Pyrinomonadaceae bacterium]
MVNMVCKLFIAIALSCVAATSGLAQRIISPEELTADLRVLKKTLKELHPGLYRYSTPVEIERKFDVFEAKLNKPLDEGEFFKLLAQMLSEIKCYHTYPNPLNQRDEIKNGLFDRKTYFPFYFQIIDRRMIVTENASPQRLAKGSQITKINGIPVEKIITKLLTTTFADGKGTLEHRLETLELDRGSGATYAIFDLMFPLFFPPQNGTYRIEA